MTKLQQVGFPVTDVTMPTSTTFVLTVSDEGQRQACEAEAQRLLDLPEPTFLSCLAIVQGLTVNQRAALLNRMAAWWLLERRQDP